MAGKSVENPNADHNIAETKKLPTSVGEAGSIGEVGISNCEIQPAEISDCGDNTKNESDQMKKVKLDSRSKRSVRWNKELVTESPRMKAARLAAASNGGSSLDPSSSSPAAPTYTETFISTISSVGIALLRWGRNVKEATRKAEDLAGNTWQHLKTNPSVADAALGRIAQGAKVLAEGGYDNIFRQTFETSPDEDLQNSFVCYLSTSAGPVMGVLYLSNSKLAYCSDSPMPFKSSPSSSSSSSPPPSPSPNDIHTQWSYYKVIIPLEKLKSVHPSSNGNNHAEKYIQILSTDDHEFWYMGFVNYEAAVYNLQSALFARHMSV